MKTFSRFEREHTIIYILFEEEEDERIFEDDFSSNKNKQKQTNTCRTNRNGGKVNLLFF